ncbi:MAG: hypothetical protein CSB19_01310 [Clostridiales bacterium]|nr:MAG: hypothetical protein CSB19_01310 [Clostridiales bacterium]
MTIADQPDIYTMPQLPVVNLKHKDDYMQLKQLFGNREVYIVSSADRLAEKSRFAKSFNGASEVAHLVINRKNIDQELLAEGQRVLRQFKNVDYITIDDELSAITSQQIRSAVDKRWDISDMVDALAAEQIVKHRMYRNAPVYKTNIDTVSSSTISGDQVDSALIDEVKRALEVDLITYLKRVDCAPKVIVMRDSNSRAVNAVAVYRELTEAEYDAMRDHPEIKTDYVEIYKENTIVIDLLAARQPTPLHNHLLMIHSEVIVDAINRGYDYSVYRLSAAKLSRVVKAGLSLSGYREIDSLAIMLTSIKAPVAIMLDAQSMLKRAYRQDRDIRSVLTNSRMALLKALVERYHDTVILTFDRAMLYDKINDIVLRENAPDRQSAYGPNLCVPYGDIYNRWLLPRAVTKALHTERVYDIGLNFFNVKASPNYPPVEAQVEVIKAFNMPLLLVDDLVDKGLRLQALERHFKAMQVPVAGLVVGIMSGLGKVRAEKKGYRILAGYYLPNMTAWYSESHLYPFIGGDAYYSGDDLASNILPSVNKIMPYMCSRNGATSGKGAIDFSMSCLHQGLSIIEKIEQKYHDAYRRPLTINRLNEVFVTPRVPYYGKKMQINHSSLPSDIIKNDVIRLEQIMTLIER